MAQRAVGIGLRGSQIIEEEVIEASIEVEMSTMGVLEKVKAPFFAQPIDDCFAFSLVCWHLIVAAKAKTEALRKQFIAEHVSILATITSSTRTVNKSLVTIDDAGDWEKCLDRVKALY